MLTVDKTNSLWPLVIVWDYIIEIKVSDQRLSVIQSCTCQLSVSIILYYSTYVWYNVVSIRLCSCKYTGIYADSIVMCI